MEKMMIWVRLLLTVRERRGGVCGCGVGASALMAHTLSSGTSRREIGAAGRPQKFVNA